MSSLGPQVTPKTVGEPDKPISKAETAWGKGFELFLLLSTKIEYIE